MNDLEAAYKKRYEDYLLPLAVKLEGLLKEYFIEEQRIDRVVSRAKSVESFINKALREVDGKQAYSDPLNQIQDQVGARIVTYYLDDVPKVTKIILRYFRPVEERLIVPDSECEFGYFGKHFVLFVPNGLLNVSASKETYPRFFEVQIKTLFQHAWGEANHDLGYKPSCEWSSDDKRRIAFTSAQAWGADTIFNDLFKKCVCMAVETKQN